MITLTMNADGPLTFNVRVDGRCVYLDNWAIGYFAEGDQIRRKRFVDIVRSGTELMFSVTNAAEVSGPQGASADSVKSFLDELGPHWFPVELDTIEVANREKSGKEPAACCVAPELLKAYFNNRTRCYGPKSGKIIDPSADGFFGLGSFVEWLGPQRDSIREGSQEFDDQLRSHVLRARDEHEQDSSWLDRRVPVYPFHPTRRASFAFGNLFRLLVLEAKERPIKKGDGLDFSHAVMASAFAGVATLDKAWKRRVEWITTAPNQLARIYGPSELDQMVSYLESSEWALPVALRPTTH